MASVGARLANLGPPPDNPDFETLIIIRVTASSMRTVKSLEQGRLLALILCSGNTDDVNDA